MRYLQLCSSEPGDLDGARSVLGDAEQLNGMHHRITVRGYGRTHHPRIRTLPVMTHRAGHIDVRATAGSYRYLLAGKGTAELHITSTGGTIVDVVGSCEVAVTVGADVAVDINVYTGTVTLTAAATATGLVRVARGAVCVVVERGGMDVDRRPVVDRIVAIPPNLTRELVERARKADRHGR